MITFTATNPLGHIGIAFRLIYRSMMKEKDKAKIVGLVAGIVFVIGFGIGVNLYSFTSENDEQERINRRYSPQKSKFIDKQRQIKANVAKMTWRDCSFARSWSLYSNGEILVAKEI